MLTYLVCSAATSAGAMPVNWGTYFDGAILYTPNEPANNQWRSKGTSAVLNEPRVNSAAATVTRVAVADSPWGFTLGVQAGKDVKALVSSAAISSAETLKHLYYTNATYLFDVGAGLAVTGGLIPGHLGYESFHAGDNPTYTRVYGTDDVPYFNWGVQATYAEGARLSGSVRVMNAWDYLSHVNDVPTYGAQVNWQATESGRLTQNFYYGPEQSDTSLEFWRFVSNTIVEWGIQDFLLVGSLGLGTEKQSTIMGTPRHDWAWGAAWLAWQPNPTWSLALRPEFFRDEDGLISGSSQTIGALTIGGEYRVPVQDTGSFALKLEYRYDRSTGSEGGFFKGDDNHLVPEQHLLIGALLWNFASLGLSN